MADIRKYSDVYELAVIKLIHLTIRECYPKVYSKEVVSFFLNYHSKDEIKRKTTQGEMLLAFEGNEIVACGYLLEEEIGGVYVSPEAQKKGYGKEIVLNLIQTAKRKGIKEVWLDATLIAYEFYLNLNFVLKEKKTDYIEENIPLDYYKMTLKL